MPSSSNEPHTFGSVPVSAFSVEMVVGEAPAPGASPRFSPSAPALAAAPLINDRRPHAPDGAMPRSWPSWPSVPPMLSPPCSLSQPEHASRSTQVQGPTSERLVARPHASLGGNPEAQLKHH